MIPKRRLCADVRDCAPWLILFAYAAVAGFAATHHEPWRDEAQAWLIARDLPLSGLIAQMGYEGSPALWHLLLFPFAQLGAPFGIEAALHYLLAVAGVGLFLVRGPFPLWFKVLLAFSSLFSYEYAAIARNYNLSLLLLFGVAALHGSRLRSAVPYGILVALLANANVHSGAMAAGLCLLYAFEARALVKRSIPVLWGLAIMAAGLAAAAAQMGLTGRNETVAIDSDPNLSVVLFAARNAWMPGSPDFAAPLALAAMTVVVLALWRCEKAALWLLLSGLGGLYAIFVFVHSGSFRHHGLILVFTVFVLWVAWGSLSQPSARGWRNAVLATLGVLLAAGLPHSVRTHRADARGLFSGARDMAAYINDHGLAGRLIVAYPSPHCSAVLPYLPGCRMWYADIQAPGTYITWDQRYRDNRAIGVVEAARRSALAPGWGPGELLLLNEPLPEPRVFGLELLHSVVDGVFSETGELMYLYQQVP